jgi:hypothetical protein
VSLTTGRVVTAAATDSYELGDVDDVHDLEPETQVGPSRAKTEQHRLARPSASGHFELEAGNFGGLGAPLQLGSEIKKDGGPVIGEYEAGYNAYATPLRSTLKAMGRVKDVSLTGAPMSPAELMSRPELARSFRAPTLGHETTEENAQDAAFDDWSTAQTKMQIDIQRFGGGQYEMAAVIADYRRVQQRLQQRRAELVRDQKTAELREIEEAAETLARIVEVSVEAWNCVGEIDEVVESQLTLDEVDTESAEALPQANRAEEQYGSTASKEQKLGSAAVVAGETAKIAADFRAKLATVGHYNVDLRSVFLLLMDKGRYDKLKEDVYTLGTQIDTLELAQEQELVQSANDRLIGFHMEFATRRNEVRADRVAARRHAARYGKRGGEKAVASMYAAEAYQELAGFATLAVEQRKTMVDPPWKPTHAYLHGYDKHRFLALGFEDDATRLDENLRAVQDQRGYFAAHLPDWLERAKAWSDFFDTHANSPLIADATDADRASGAP